MTLLDDGTQSFIADNTPTTETHQANVPMDQMSALKATQQLLLKAQQQLTQVGESNSRLRSQIRSLACREAQASHDAYHDDLTCLPNRRLLLDRLHQVLGHAVRQRKQVVLLLLDLDGFKSVNDTLGHAAGDKLLKAVAERLVASIRSTDTACRYGGDEFVVMLPEMNNPNDSAFVERKIRAKLAAPYVIDGVDVNITVSIGSAVFPVNAKNRSELLQHADTEMYRAKASVARHR